PHNPPVIAEPGVLSAGEFPGADNGQLSSLLLADFAFEITQDLAVAERTRRGQAVTKSGRSEPADLFDETRSPQRIDAGGDPSVECRPVDGKTDLHHIREYIAALR